MFVDLDCRQLSAIHTIVNYTRCLEWLSTHASVCTSRLLHVCWLLRLPSAKEVIWTHTHADKRALCGAAAHGARDATHGVRLLCVREENVCAYGRRRRCRGVAPRVCMREYVVADICTEGVLLAQDVAIAGSMSGVPALRWLASESDSEIKS